MLSLMLQVMMGSTGLFDHQTLSGLVQFPRAVSYVGKPKGYARTILWLTIRSKRGSMRFSMTLASNLVKLGREEWFSVAVWRDVSIQSLLMMWCHEAAAAKQSHSWLSNLVMWSDMDQSFSVTMTATSPAYWFWALLTINNPIVLIMLTTLSLGSQSWDRWRLEGGLSCWGQSCCWLQ